MGGSTRLSIYFALQSFLTNLGSFHHLVYVALMLVIYRMCFCTSPPLSFGYAVLIHPYLMVEMVRCKTWELPALHPTMWRKPVACAWKGRSLYTEVEFLVPVIPRAGQILVTPCGLLIKPFLVFHELIHPNFCLSKLWLDFWSTKEL